MQIVPEIWPSWAALANDLGVSYPTAHSWSHRGLPPKRFGEIIKAARARGAHLTFEMLSMPLADQLPLPPQEAAE